VQAGAIRQVVASVQPVVQSVVRQETLASGGDDSSDLVARIISQLTPFIQVPILPKVAKIGLQIIRNYKYL
jgi:hypothetical protein